MRHFVLVFVVALAGCGSSAPPGIDNDEAYVLAENAAEEKAAELRSEMNDLETRIEQLEAQNGKLAARNSDLEARSSDLEARSSDLEAEIRNLQSELTQIKRRQMFGY